MFKRVYTYFKKLLSPESSPLQKSFWGTKWLYFIFGPILLLLLATGQGVTPFSPFPTYNRTALHLRGHQLPISEATMDSLVPLLKDTLSHAFTKDLYKNLDETEVLKTCNLLLDSLLHILDLPKGRTVKRIKEQSGLTRLLGLSYGGPAYHDPLTSEIALVSSKDLPTTHFWRIQALCHETAHAKGFTRELDAEILTQLALLLSSHPLFVTTGLIQFLSKSGYEIDWPPLFKKEREESKVKRKATQKKQYMVNFLRKINRKLSVQNSGKKYGQREKDEQWDINHPYYSTIFYFLKNKPEFFNYEWKHE